MKEWNKSQHGEKVAGIMAHAQRVHTPRPLGPHVSLVVWVLLVVGILTFPWKILLTRLSIGGYGDGTGEERGPAGVGFVSFITCTFSLLLAICWVLAEVQLASKVRRKLLRRLEHSFNRPSRIQDAWMRAGMESEVEIFGVGVRATPRAAATGVPTEKRVRDSKGEDSRTAHALDALDVLTVRREEALRLHDISWSVLVESTVRRLML